MFTNFIFDKVETSIVVELSVHLKDTVDWRGVWAKQESCEGKSSSSVAKISGGMPYPNYLYFYLLWIHISIPSIFFLFHCLFLK